MDPSPKDKAKEEAILQLAWALEGEALEDYLETACGGDHGLRMQVVRRLTEEGATIASSATREEATTIASDAGDPSASRQSGEFAGAQIGPYKLVERLGEGGMGAVWLAVQEKPVKREVALKIIKAGMDSDEIIARFKAERQALAMMEHPNIAQVYDAGATETGRPFFVMEMVKGVPVTQFCDERRLRPGDRLRLFIDICNGLQHAHQKGVIHRDIKPSNVLVSEHDGKPVPKLIDFGIAKATDQNLTDCTLFTQLGQIVGTPTYMSPEQASGVGVDTRTDVYALGVLLYELLTGTTPISAKELREAGVAGMQRLIVEAETPRPSTRIATKTADLADVARRRSTEPPTKLTRILRGDLDWIVMKALAKEPGRRYQSVSDFGDDVARHLNLEAVEASPPSRVYRLRKFVRRNRVATAILAAIIAGAGVAAWQSIVATKALGEKEVALGEKEEALAESRFNIAKVFEEKAGFAIGEARGGRKFSEPDLRKAWLYSLEALSGEAGAEGKLPTAEAQLRMREIRRTTYRELWRSPVAPESFDCVAFSRDGTMAVAGLGNEVMVWSTQSGDQMGGFRDLGGTVQTVAFAPSGTAVIIFDDSGTATVRDIASGEIEAEFSLQTNGTPCFAVDKNVTMVLVGSTGASVTLWDLETQSTIATFPRVTDAFKALALSPDGSRAACGSSGAIIRVWDVSSGKEVAQFSGHSDAIECVAFSPGGDRLVSGSSDKIVRIWDIASGGEIAQFRGSVDGVHRVAFSPDGARVLCTSEDGALRLWDIASGREIGDYSGHSLAVNDTVFSPDGSRVLSVSSDGSVRVWDGATRDEIGRATFRGHSGLVRCVAVSPDGTKILSGSVDGSLRLWDRFSKRELVRISGDQKQILCAVFSRDGSQVITGSGDRTIRFWDAETGKETARFDAHSAAWSVAISPDGTKLLSGAKSGSVRLWDLEARREIAHMEGHDEDVYAVAFDPTGFKGLSCSLDNSARVWDLVEYEEIAKLDFNSGYPSVGAFSPDGTYVVLGSTDGWISKWSGASGDDAVHFAKQSSIPMGLAISPNGRRLASSGMDGKIRLWDREFEYLIAEMSGHDGFVSSLAFSPDGSLLVSGSLDKTVRVWDVAPRDRIAKVVGNKINCISFSPSGEEVLTCHGDGEMTLLDATKGTEIATFSGHRGAVLSASFSADGSVLVSGSEDGTIRVWNTTTREVVAEIPVGDGDAVNGVDIDPSGSLVLACTRGDSVHLFDIGTGSEVGLFDQVGPVRGVAFSPDGTQMLPTSVGRTLRLWDIEARRESARFPHAGAATVTAAAFGPQGTRIVSGTAGGTLHVWDLDSGLEIARLSGHQGIVFSVAFSPDGRHVLSGGGDGTVRLWDIAREQSIAQFASERAITITSVAFSPDGTAVAFGSEVGMGQWWDISSIIELSVGEPASEQFRKIYDASFRLYPYRMDGFRLVEAPPPWNLEPVNGFQFPQPSQHVEEREVGGSSVLRNDRPEGRDLIEWLLDPVPDTRSAGERAPDRFKRSLGVKNLESARRIAELIEPAEERESAYALLAMAMVVFAENAFERDLHGLAEQRLLMVRSLADDCEQIETILPALLKISDLAGKLQRLNLENLQQSPGSTANWLRVGRMFDFGVFIRAYLRRALGGELAETSISAWSGLIANRFIREGAKVSDLDAMVKLIPFGANWSYWDRGEVADGWQQPLFDDSKWDAGPAQLGFGDGDEATTLSFGDEAEGKPITTYFRHSFDVDDPGRISALYLDIVRDDGVVLYLNGREVVRDNLPDGAITPASTALYRINNAAESDVLTFGIPVDGLVAGTNLLAVEVHQAAATSSDLSFDLTLVAAPEAPGAIAKLDGMTPLIWEGLQLPIPTVLRVELLRQQGRLEQALGILDEEGRTPGLAGSAFYESTRGELLEALGRSAEAMAAYEKALESDGEPNLTRRTERLRDSLLARAIGGELELSLPEFATSYRPVDVLRKKDLLKRYEFQLRQQRSGDEVQKFQSAIFEAPPRDPSLSKDLIDLTDFYNASLYDGRGWHSNPDNNLSRLPATYIPFGGAEFDLRGLVQLDGSDMNSTYAKNYPQRVTGIPIGQKAAQIHILGGLTRVKEGLATGVKVAAYIIHYEDGSDVEIPLLHGRDLADYWEPSGIHRDQVGWLGTTPAGHEVGLTMKVWQNPEPEKAIAHLDFVVEEGTAAPFLVAISVEY